MKTIKVFFAIIFLILITSCSGAKRMAHYPAGCRPAQKVKHEMPVPTYDKTVKK